MLQEKERRTTLRDVLNNAPNEAKHANEPVRDKLWRRTRRLEPISTTICWRTYLTDRHCKVQINPIDSNHLAQHCLRPDTFLYYEELWQCSTLKDD